MEYWPLKITLISAEDLKYVNHVTKMSVYADVTISGDPQTKLEIPADENCGSNPNWNYTITFIVEETAAQQMNLVIRLVSDRLLHDKDIGEVRVPIKQFLDCKEEVSDHNVRLPNGEEKGKLKLCCKIGKKFSVPVAAPPHETERGTSAETPVEACPAARPRAGYQPLPPAAYPYNPPQQGAYPHNFPQQGAYPPQQPPHLWHSPTPAQGQWYTGSLLHAWPGCMPAQQPAAGLGQASAGGLVGRLYIVRMLSDTLANFTSMSDGGWLEGLFDS
ncbi:hypothetical protein SLEP1_g28907 [Rubroshorea leprosula]|uniref:C2 domain-containing protein n=1 Tax=Rubroshorea leprosula TaxID=152421 RepID=A0AAV5K4T2_9ROSI|nr:hypothetical protein SLEP1_g28907 [Rubroshorea leprosula]